MRCATIKKLQLSSVKKSLLLLSFLCVLPLSLLNGWPGGLQTLTAVNPFTTSSWSRGDRNVTILLWYWPFGRSFRLKGDVCWDHYRIPRCRLVDQRSLFPVADVVVFHNHELVQGRQKLPFDLPRPQGQRWAWMSLEAPIYNGNLHQFSNFFNMTMTYRRDADVTVPYGEVLPKEDDSVEDVLQNKSVQVCWVVSNYKSQHRRSQVYKNLSETIPVKVYGRWTKKPLTSRALIPTISRCYFYLAFENSDGKDYITEKLWRNAYQGGAVPVVLGPPLDDYKAVAPPKSFIHVDEFASVKELGEYLQQLAEDKKRYSQYFNWKHEWRVKLYTDWRERLCRICSQYDSLPPHKVYSDLEAWVNGIST
ncbi:alpha-(1,3)-fucosyltransferase 7 [Notolabrus celidotus]|uniref:alpha-(1,3)-fucosyltransferase 7 n=1 Tax=Notolabrus celidotus TaxID=1203425 RepID=UPI001490553D|nr:alpha-(1,3)-fucosyltransferase 7 [Notolabrus celidotus]